MNDLLLQFLRFYLVVLKAIVWLLSFPVFIAIVIIGVMLLLTFSLFREQIAISVPLAGFGIGITFAELPWRLASLDPLGNRQTLRTIGVSSAIGAIVFLFCAVGCFLLDSLGPGQLIAGGYDLGIRVCLAMGTIAVVYACAHFFLYLANTANKDA